MRMMKVLLIVALAGCSAEYSDSNDSEEAGFGNSDTRTVATIAFAATILAVLAYASTCSVSDPC